LVSILYMLLIYTFHIQYSSRLFDDKWNEQVVRALCSGLG
jgi:hypothetical protein